MSSADLELNNWCKHLPIKGIVSLQKSRKWHSRRWDALWTYDLGFLVAMNVWVWEPVKSIQGAAIVYEWLPFWDDIHFAVNWEIASVLAAAEGAIPVEMRTLQHSLSCHLVMKGQGPRSRSLHRFSIFGGIRAILALSLFLMFLCQQFDHIDHLKPVLTIILNALWTRKRLDTFGFKTGTIRGSIVLRAILVRFATGTIYSPLTIFQKDHQPTNLVDAHQMAARSLTSVNCMRIGSVKSVQSTVPYAL